MGTRDVIWILSHCMNTFNHAGMAIIAWVSCYCWLNSVYGKLYDQQLCAPWYSRFYDSVCALIFEGFYVFYPPFWLCVTVFQKIANFWLVNTARHILKYMFVSGTLECSAFFLVLDWMLISDARLDTLLLDRGSKELLIGQL